MIAGLTHAFSNETYIDLHYVTFMCYALLFSATQVLTVLSGNSFALQGVTEKGTYDLLSLKY